MQNGNSTLYLASEPNTVHLVLKIVEGNKVDNDVLAPLEQRKLFLQHREASLQVPSRRLGQHSLPLASARIARLCCHRGGFDNESMMNSQPIAIIAPSDSGQSLEFSLAAFACGLLVLEGGADRFVDSSAFLAKQLGVSPTLVGLLICGAEWEELVVVAAAMSQRQGSLALGSLMGSSVANILWSFSLGLLSCRQEVMRFDQSSRDLHRHFDRSDDCVPGDALHCSRWSRMGWRSFPDGCLCRVCCTRGVDDVQGQHDGTRE